MVGKGHKVNNLVHVAFFVLCEALPLYEACGAGDGVGLYAWFEVCEGVGTEVSFEGVVAVGCAFLSAACFLSFCHGCENFFGS